MNKLQKAKKDDFALEESARAQKAKYDEASDDVQRRMLDIKEAEVDSINDLGRVGILRQSKRDSDASQEGLAHVRWTLSALHLHLY
jgi:hypothetical protein